MLLVLGMCEKYKPEGNVSRVDLEVVGRINLKWVFQENGYEDENWIPVAQAARSANKNCRRLAHCSLKGTQTSHSAYVQTSMPAEIRVMFALSLQQMLCVVLTHINKSFSYSSHGSAQPLTNSWFRSNQLTRILCWFLSYLKMFIGCEYTEELDVTTTKNVQSLRLGSVQAR